VDFTGLLFLGFLWFLFNILTRNRGTGPSRPRSGPPLGTAGGGGDATQREGSQLETLFRELQRTLEEAAGPQGRPAGVPLPRAEEVEERATLEANEEVVSLEHEVKRAPRVRVDRDDRAEQIEVARVAAAEARSGALTRADHAKFDSRIRAEPADATAVRAPTPEQLRKAIVWREILGPPIALRDDER
jgi:hypothetical protein